MRAKNFLNDTQVFSSDVITHGLVLFYVELDFLSLILLCVPSGCFFF